MGADVYAVDDVSRIRCCLSESECEAFGVPDVFVGVLVDVRRYCDCRFTSMSSRVGMIFEDICDSGCFDRIASGIVRVSGICLK